MTELTHEQTAAEYVRIGGTVRRVTTLGVAYDVFECRLPGSTDGRYLAVQHRVAGDSNDVHRARACRAVMVRAYHKHTAP